MLPGFTGYSTNHENKIPSNQGFGTGTINSKAQGITLAGIAGPGCTIECYCSLFTYKCYERCDGRVVRAWDNGWCFSSW
jgi:hypothetical protein